LRAHRFETHDEIGGQIGTISPETLPRRSHQWKRGAVASIPLIDGQQASAMIAVVQGSRRRHASAGEQPPVSFH